MITPEQIRAARALLGMPQKELAARAGVSVATLRRMEWPLRPAAPARQIVRVQRALEESGAEFIEGGVKCRADEGERDAAEMLRRIRSIQHEVSALPVLDATFSEADLYGDDGLPA